MMSLIAHSLSSPSTSSAMLAVTDIPIEILLDNLLPRLPLNDLLKLQSTNKFFAALCADESFWRKKSQEDFNFPDESTARTSGWKFIYLRLTKPRVFVWGQKDQGRLGMTTFPHSTLNNVSYPLELKFPGIRIVHLAAGGMSFQALDSEGSIHVWGALDGSQYALNRDGFSEPGKVATTPLRLQMPISIRSISCGRLHSSSLDSNNQIWTFMNWGRPFRLVSDLLNDPGFTPIQVECGWNFSSALTRSGDVLVWWPFSDPLRTVIEVKMGEMDNQGESFRAHSTDGTINCTPWDLQTDPIVLPSLPFLPKLSDAESDSESVDDVPRIIKIAGFDNAMVALTNQGHVLLFDALGEVSLGNWQYLPYFSDASRIRDHEVFSNTNLQPPQADFKITHISAHFRTFIAYSGSIVLMGSTETKPDMQPKIIPGLQNQAVISVVAGDYHFAAVTATGKLLTWGQYSEGALGLGDPGLLQPGTPGGFASEALRVQALETRRGRIPDVEVPTEVRFDSHRKKPKDRFCVSAAASGWHTGALVIDMKANENEDDSDLEIEKVAQPSGRTRRYFGIGGRGQGETPPILPGGIPTQDPALPYIGRGGGMFRIGYAGRGMHRGRGT
ncbi:regulator of chromosome condensation 1/beta-lactamase-inhibitor protein II [Lentinula guzmanii]|uniref:Regulator of chromosome condensation 1/beta-lactamase-inhibitor protein II n=1 Tax=Lentinula guzmanii TaxID=2804957 RepID=A0AA38JGB9_9AGAR|nr:regulator of chromosome condensation 1/beta-lactamase-inhibitor protein II [Lentinula guzmanii]